MPWRVIRLQPPELSTGGKSEGNILEGRLEPTRRPQKLSEREKDIPAPYLLRTREEPANKVKWPSSDTMNTEEDSCGRELHETLRSGKYLQKV